MPCNLVQQSYYKTTRIAIVEIIIKINEDNTNV